MGLDGQRQAGVALPPGKELELIVLEIGGPRVRPEQVRKV